MLAALAELANGTQRRYRYQKAWILGMAAALFL